MEGWDLIFTQSRPVIRQKVETVLTSVSVLYWAGQVCGGPVHCLAAHIEGWLLCCGGDGGEVGLLQLSPGLAEVTRAEKVIELSEIDFCL